MVNAGASIEAFLKLDASGFKTGIETATRSVTKFKEAMLDIGKEANTFNSGINLVSKALDALTRKMSLLESVDTKAVNNFKTMASALENVATAAQRLSVDAQRGSVGIEALNTIMQVFEAGVSSAEIVVKNLTTSISNLGNRSRESSTKLSESEQIMRSQFQLLENTIDLTIGKESEARYITQMLRNEYGLTGLKLVEVRNQLLQTVQAVQQYNSAIGPTQMNTQRWINTLNTLGASFTKVSTTLQSWKSLTDSIVNSTAQNLSTSVERINSSLNSLDGKLNTTSNNLKTATNDAKQFSSTLNSTDGTIAKVNTGVQQYGSEIRIATKYMQEGGAESERYRVLQQGVNLTIEDTINTIRRQSMEVQKNGAEKLRAMGYTGKLSIEENRLASSEEKVVGTSNQATASIQRQSTAMNQGSASANRMSTSTSGLGRAMSSLRMMVTMVGSMIAYNFVHNLAMATTETINAKSEMNGYFQMLGYTKGQVADFNAELDKTVQLFPRLNKYALGETISSIGVEFELSTAEMKKAMPVVSMITSEYLRAGRNVNEASLAVKDILQGEFQRLSRETGVKQENLMEAGWSGDKSDVMGLLEALDKVGKSRNWDTFVTKANSLNDAVLILQNRFSEWSADMVEKVQPSIVHAFNTIMTVAGNFADILNGVIDWLTGNPIGQAVGWTLLATHITSVVGALIHLRTGANLTQIAQMGLTKSIGATILGLEAETVAEHGLRNAIVSKITSIEAETLANEENIITRRARLQAITSTITGYEYETIASKGLTKSLIASSFGAKEATLTQYGLTTAIAEATTGMEAESLASMTLAQRIALISATTIPATAVVLAFAVAFGKLALDTMEATNNMSNFYDIQKNGKQYVDDAKDSVNNLKGRISELKKTQSKYAEGSKEYQNVGKAIEDLNGKLDLANNNVNANYEAWQKVNSAQKNYDTTKQELQLDLQRKINQSLIDTGLSSKEANELSNNYLNEAIDGSRQLYEALQSVSLQYSKEAGGVAKLTEYWQNQGLTPEEIKIKLDPYIDAQNNIAGDIEKMKLSTDLVEVASAWAKLQVDQIDLSLKENLPKIEAGDWEAGLTGLFKGFLHGSWSLPIFGKDGFWGWVFKQFKIQETYGGKGWEGLAQFFNDAGHNFINMMIDNFNPLKRLNNKSLGWDPVRDLYRWIHDSISNGGKKIDMDINALFDTLSTTLNSYFVDGLKSFNFLGSITDAINQSIGSVDIFGMIIDAISPDPVSAENGESHPEVLDEMYQVIVQPIVDWWNGFMADPLSYMGNLAQGSGIGALLGALTMGDDGTSVLTWVNDNIVVPLSTGITTGIANIPIIGTIAQMLGLVPMENDNAYQTGYNLIDHFKRGVEQKIGEIPIIGDIARMLGLIPQEKPHAQQEGHGIGSSISDGTKGGMQNLGQFILSEFNDALGGIGKLGEEAYNTARAWANQLWDGVNSVLQRKSPGFFHDQFQLEFGQDIPNAITEASSTAYSVAQTYGQQISDGISATNFNTIGFDSAVGEYQADAQMVADSSYLMGTTTTTAFNDMTLAVNQSTMNMQGNVVSSYSTMQQSQSQLLNNMKQSNTTAYNEMYQKSNQSLLQMRDSTSNVTHQMINAWDHMKNSIIASANQLKSDSTAHFNQLSNTIGDFYRKIQNPSNWGAGAGSNGAMVRGARHPSAGKSFARVMTRGATHHGAGSPSPYSRGGSGKTMTLRALKNLICPTGSCDIFDGYDLSQEVNVDEFLSSITGEHGFGWGDWSGRHYEHIRTTSNAWRMQSPTINLVGGIPTNADYKVGDFENGTPKISFGAFQSMAESIFTAIPYRFYYDSNWKGSWLGALQAGACNCSDGAEALIAFAQACGFDGYKQHGTWTNSAGQKFGHFWAVINGKKMDTTGWQHGYGWSPSNSAGSPPVRRATHSPMSVDTGSVNITVNINEPVYGVDALDEKIQESVKQGLREEFNDPYTVAI